MRRRKFRSNPLSRKKIFLVSFLIVVLVYSVALLLISLFSLYSPYRVEVINYDFVVKNAVGFNLDTDALHFGGSLPGSTSTRSMNLQVNQDSRVVITFDGPGDLVVDKNDFIVLANSSQPLTFYLTIPVNITEGNYSGTVTFNFFKP